MLKVSFYVDTSLLYYIYQSKILRIYQPLHLQYVGKCLADNADALMNHELLLPGHLINIYIKEKLEETLQGKNTQMCVTVPILVYVSLCLYCMLTYTFINQYSNSIEYYSRLSASKSEDY